MRSIKKEYFWFYKIIFIHTIALHIFYEKYQQRYDAYELKKL